MHDSPKIKFVSNRSATGQPLLTLVDGEDTYRTIEVRPGEMADYDLTAFPWVSSTEEIGRKAIRVSVDGTDAMWLFKSHPDDKLYYSLDGSWGGRKLLPEPSVEHWRHYYLELTTTNGQLGAPVLHRHRDEDTPLVRHVRVLFVGADSVEGLNQGRLQGVLDWSNGALQNSHVPLRLQLAGLACVSYVSTDNLSADLAAMHANVDLHARINLLRRLFGAEVVAMIVPAGGGGMGIAYLDSFGSDRPYTVMREDALFSGFANWLCVHEIAHILGARHDTGFENGTFRTVMNKNFDVNHIQFFSNPTAYTPGPFRTGGTRTGDATHDTAKVLTERAARITAGAPAAGATEPVPSGMV